jgi:hypothetical protein
VIPFNTDLDQLREVMGAEDPNPAWTQAVDRAAERFLAQEKPCERLTWADSKAVDRFDGFTVTSHTSTQHTHSHPLQRSSEGERIPGFGSAALLKG